MLDDIDRAEPTGARSLGAMRLEAVHFGGLEAISAAPSDSPLRFQDRGEPSTGFGDRGRVPTLPMRIDPIARPLRPSAAVHVPKLAVIDSIEFVSISRTMRMPLGASTISVRSWTRGMLAIPATAPREAGLCVFAVNAGAQARAGRPFDPDPGCPSASLAADAERPEMVT